MTPPGEFVLVHPTQEHLPSFVAALERGWDPPGTTAQDVLAAIDRDAGTLLSLHHDPDAKGAPVKLSDGSIELTTDPDNAPSQRVIAANGGVLHEQFTKVPQLGGGEGYRFPHRALTTRCHSRDASVIPGPHRRAGRRRQ